MSRSGLFAMYNNNTDAFSTAASIYYGLFSMQHRGMDATGICITVSYTHLTLPTILRV